ncbi:hypothetical protein RBB78_02835 [Tunturiibacter empetritectus]
MQSKTFLVVARTAHMTSLWPFYVFFTCRLLEWWMTRERGSLHGVPMT